MSLPDSTASGGGIHKRGLVRNRLPMYLFREIFKLGTLIFYDGGIDAIIS